jgi:hypothetical protein
VSSDLERFLEFFAAQGPKQAPRFPTVKADKVLSFMGTTSRPGSWARLSVHRVLGLEAGPSERDLRVRLAGELPLRPEPGECLTVHLTRLERYQGYQVKTRPLEGDLAALVEPAEGGIAVKGSHLYTVHHSPYTLEFFERIPLEEVRDLVAGVRHAVVGVGATANVSPRFVFHHEVRGGRLALFHGDGLALKTYMNLKVNRQETRLVVDLDDWRGWVLRGTVEEIAPASAPVAYEKVVAGFAAGSWSRPSRVFRFVADALEEIAPV